MANPNVISLQLAAAVANGIAQSQAVASTAPLTLNGSLVSGGVANLVTARRVLAASSGADVGKTLTIVGTTRDGFAQTEILTLASSPATVYTNLDFLTVTSITPSAAMAGNITVGTNGIGSTPWVVDDFTHPCWSLRVGVTIVSGTATWTVEHTYDDPNKLGTSLVPPPFGFSIEEGSFSPPALFSISALTGKSASGIEAGYTEGPIFAHRLTITTGTGLVVMQSIQAGLGGF